MILTKEHVRALLAAMEKSGKDCHVDWTNRHIEVLSEIIQHPTKRLSSGEPLEYRDIIFHLSEEGTRQTTTKTFTG